jgi:multiple antibiotic resistance protein
MVTGFPVDLQFAAKAFATAFTIIDPIGIIPITLTTTASFSPARRMRIVDQAVLVAGGIILFMAVVGQVILRYLGITLPAFTIAGGVLLLLISIDMLFARQTRARLTDEEEREATEVENPAVFPLAVPMLSGPGTIATVLLLVNTAHHDATDLFIIFLAYAVALSVAWACMRSATFLSRIIGTTGIHVVTRLLGVILAALAVQFILDGLKATQLFHGVA